LAAGDVDLDDAEVRLVVDRQPLDIDLVIRIQERRQRRQPKRQKSEYFGRQAGLSLLLAPGGPS
jgi:hypothetical protein